MGDGARLNSFLGKRHSVGVRPVYPHQILWFLFPIQKKAVHVSIVLRVPILFLGMIVFEIFDELSV
jgi:hypothetical protein